MHNRSEKDLESVTYREIGIIEKDVYGDTAVLVRV